jgi:TPR repeat protein
VSAAALLSASVSATSGAGCGSGPAPDRCYQQQERSACRTLCRQGKARACRVLADSRYRNGPDQDHDAAYRWFRAGCALRDTLRRATWSTAPRPKTVRYAIARSCAIAGHLHEHPPPAKKRKSGAKAGAKADPDPRPGKPAKRAPRKRDLAMAVVFYRHACRLGYASACVDLGSAFMHGRGAPKNSSAAWRHYSRACSLGKDHGCQIAPILVRRSRSAVR